MTQDSKPTVCLPGLSTRDQLFLWHLSRLPLPEEVDQTRLAAACERCRYPLARAWELQTGYPRAWARMLQKRHCWLSGEPDPLGDATPRRVANARRTDLLRRHRKMAERIRKAGWLP